MTVFILISLLWHPACFFLRTPSSLTYMELLLLPSNISVAREIDTPFMAWIQPSTMSRVYTYDTTLMKNSLWPQCEILAPRTTSKIAMNWTNAPKLASSARSLCSVSDYSESLTLHWAFSSSLWMFISLCSWDGVGFKRILSINTGKRYLSPPILIPLPGLLSFLLSVLLPFFIYFILLSCKAKVV